MDGGRVSRGLRECSHDAGRERFLRGSRRAHHRAADPGIPARRDSQTRLADRALFIRAGRGKKYAARSCAVRKTSGKRLMLADKDRIFTNIYGLEDLSLTGAMSRGL